MRFSTTSLLIVSALIELTAGIALLVFPSALTHLLVGGGLDSPESELVARIAGAALLAIGLSCGLDHHPGNPRAGLVTGLSVYNAFIVILLIRAGVGDKMHALGLWPAVILHAILLTWCLVRLRSMHQPDREGHPRRPALKV
jgi:hypothetical protein